MGTPPRAPRPTGRRRARLPAGVDATAGAPDGRAAGEPPNRPTEHLVGIGGDQRAGPAAVPVGHEAGCPWERQIAAATAANTASEPLTGGPADGSIVTSTRGMSTART